jgi:hypothetical protein
MSNPSDERLLDSLLERYEVSELARCYVKSLLHARDLARDLEERGIKFTELGCQDFAAMCVLASEATTEEQKRIAATVLAMNGLRVEEAPYG